MVTPYSNWKRWGYLKVTNPSSTSDVQVPMTFNLNDFKNISYDARDIRFTDIKNNPLPYWIETITNFVSAKIYVKLPANDNKIKVFWGNSKAVSESSIDNTMDAGLRYFYHSGKNFETLLGTDIDTSINHVWSTNVVKINSNSWETLSDAVSIKWQGWVKPDGLGNTIFYVTSDDGQRLYLNNNLVIDNWTTQSDTEKSYTYNLQVITPLEYKWFDEGGGSTAKLGWDSVNGSKVYPIPSTSLRCKKYVAIEPTLSLGDKYINTSYLTNPSVLPIIVDFNVDVINGYNPLNAQFTDLSVGSPSAWSWNFGDGQTSTDQNPIHQYNSVGSFDVSLTVTIDNIDYTNKKYNFVVVLPDPPVTDFSVDLPTGTSYHDVIFTDLSTNTPHSWYWEFGDGQISRLQNPSHRYQLSGTYTVKLTATNSGGGDTKTKTDYITVTLPTAPVADFTVNDTDITIPTEVQFTDLSTNKPVSWNWDFGDGNTSTEKNPKHVYASISTYAIKLITTNEGGSDTEIKTGYIVVSYKGFSLNDISAPITTSVMKNVRQSGSLRNMTFCVDDFSSHINNPNATVLSDFILGNSQPLDMLLNPKVTRNLFSNVKTKAIYNAHAPITNAVIKQTRLIGDSSNNQTFYSAYSGEDKVALIGNIQHVNGQQFANVEAILYGNLYRQLVRTNAFGIFGDYYDTDTYYKITCISENGIVYDSIKFEEIGADVYRMIVSRRTKSNATFRQMHRKFI